MMTGQATLRTLFVAALILVFPTRLVAPWLRWMGYRVERGARVGFSLLLAPRISLGKGSRIGHFNLFVVRRLLCGPDALVGRSNLVHGPMSVAMAQAAALGNRNRITRGPSPAVVAWGAAVRLARGSKITSDHQIDCTRSVSLGEFSILAGSGSQVWTHGYVHAHEGPGRYRVDGGVTIGHNVYVGSRCILNLGVSIAPSCIVGAGTVVSKPLTEVGMYVGAPVRRLPRPVNPEYREDLWRANASALCEPVYQKRQ